MDLEKLAFEIGMLLVGALSTWGAMKSQVADLRKAVADQVDKSEENLRKITALEGLVPKINGIDALALKVNTLETQHDGQAEQLKEALRKLEDVTGKLQSIAIEMAKVASK